MTSSSELGARLVAGVDLLDDERVLRVGTGVEVLELAADAAALRLLGGIFFEVWSSWFAV
jgi:hypothetical protein